MRMLKKHIANICIITVCILVLVSCGKNENSISYGDVVYYTLENSSNHFVPQKGTNIKFLRTYDEATALLSDLKIGKSTSIIYDENYFQKNNLLAISFTTNKNWKHTVEDLILVDGILTVYLNENIPEYSDLIGIGKVIFIDISKGSVPEDVSIDVQFKQIIEK